MLSSFSTISLGFPQSVIIFLLLSKVETQLIHTVSLFHARGTENGDREQAQKVMCRGRINTSTPGHDKKSVIHNGL